jgi:hypothetical protein
MNQILKKFLFFVTSTTIITIFMLKKFFTLKTNLTILFTAPISVFLFNKFYKHTNDTEHTKIEKKLLSNIKTDYKVEKVDIGDDLYINTLSTKKENVKKPVLVLMHGWVFLFYLSIF